MQINFSDILKNAQNIQEQMGKFQEKLYTICVTGTSGGGMVDIDLNGRMEVLAVRIAPEVVETGDIEMLQDLIMAAFTSGLEKIKEAVNREMGSMTGGLNASGLAGLLGGFPGGA